MRFLRYAGSWRFPGAGFMASWTASRRGTSVTPTGTLVIWSFYPRSKPSSKPVGNVTVQNGSQDLVGDGESVSERRVARIMKENKMSPRLNKRRTPVTTDSNHKMSPSPNLLEQDFDCLIPNAVWLADITYIDTDEG